VRNASQKKAKKIMKRVKLLCKWATLLAFSPCVLNAMAGQRVTQSEDQAIGDGGGGPHAAVSISEHTRVSNIEIIYGDRINRIILHGADGSQASFGGKKGSDKAEPIDLGPDEYLVGFKGLCSTGGRHKGWYRVQAIIHSSRGERLSKSVGTGGTSNIGLIGPLKVTVYMKEFTAHAPDGHEVVGLVGKTGDVIDSVRLISQAR
jgi:hypothetical protein